MVKSARDSDFSDVDDERDDVEVTIPSLTIEEVKKAIVESVGDIHTIALRLHVDRVALRRYINDHPEAQEAIKDEILSARERVMKQTYDDAIAGSQVARADFFRMTGGMFDKKEDKASETQQIIIKYTKPKDKFKVLDAATGETSYVDEKLQPVEIDDEEDEEEIDEENYPSDDSEEDDDTSDDDTL